MVGSAWATRGDVTAPEEKGGSAGPREDDGDVEGLEPEVGVSAVESPDRD